MFKKKIFVGVWTAALVATPLFSAIAQDGTVPPPSTNPIIERKEEQRLKAEEKKTVFEERKENALERKDAFKEKAEERKANAQERIDTRKENLEERKENFDERREAKKERLDTRRKTIIKNHFHQMMRRFDAALERQRLLAGRIQSRIDKMEENGIDASRAQEALDRAKASWQKAKDAVEAIKGEIENVVNAEDPKVIFESVRELVQAAREKIKASHAALVETVRILKGMSPARSEVVSPESNTSEDADASSTGQ